MLRFVNICLVLGLVALAYVIYQVKYEARALDSEITLLGREIDTERDAIAVLRAEWSLLNRPERIERLAQKFLKLAPARPSQLVTLDTVADRDFDRNRAQIAATSEAQPSPAKAVKPATKIKAAVASAAGTDTAPVWPEAKVVRPVEASAQ